MKKTTLIITTLLALNISHNANSESEKSTPASAAETASTARARLADFSDSALSVKIFSFVSTRDYAEFTAIREDLMLQIMDIVTQAGTGFAFPSRTVYLGKRTCIYPELIEAAVQKTRQWWNEQKLPFPDFSPQEIAKMSNSAPYP